MSKFSRIIVISAALLAGAVMAFGADESCYKAKAECVKYIRELAEQGNADAQFLLGVMYSTGRGVVTDKREAFRWYRSAAEQGYASAQNNLGWMYDNGNGVAEDKREAARWYQLAAEQGDVESQFNLGVMYNKGEGVPKDKGEALRWYQLAAEQGDASAQYNLGVMYNKGEGVPKDKGEALRWYQLAAEQGYASAQYNLGWMYDNGNGVAEDKREAFRWYKLAAEQGDAVAQKKLGWMYGEGVGVVKDEREALRWFRLAAEQGNASAQFNLGVMYNNGKGTVQNEREAYIWFLISKASGEEKANKELQKNYWQQYLISADILSAKREAEQRFRGIERKRNSTESFGNNFVQKGDKGFAVANPPKQINIAAEVFENTWRSVVMIKNAEGQGSGVIIRPNMVATNCHAIEGGGVVVYKPENRRVNENSPFSAKIIYRKEEHDFCILEVKGLWGFPAKIRRYGTLKIGENVYALGAPKGLDLSLSSGIISQLRQDGRDRIIQTDAAISPGSSGGGLFDSDGNFIGIMTSKFVGEDVEGIGFAIPADLVLEF